MTVEMDDCIATIDTSFGESEKNISDNISILVIYRLRKKYGCDFEIRIVGSFETMCKNSVLLKERKIDYDLKQMMWQFNILFGEDTIGNINSTEAHKKKLFITDKWVNVETIRKASQDSMRNKDGIEITDIIIESLHDNSEYNDIWKVLNRSDSVNVHLWYIKNEEDFYANYAEKKESYGKLFPDNEIEDISYEVTRIIESNIDNTSFIGRDIVNCLIDYGKELFEKGIRCVECAIPYDRNPNLYECKVNIIGAFLVYLAETYNISINARNDEQFCRKYSVYQSCIYGTSDDIFSRYNEYYPVMLYVNDGNINFVYIRDVINEYTLTTVSMGELDQMLIGIKNIDMHKETVRQKSKFKTQGFIHIDSSNKESVLDTNFPNNELEDKYSQFLSVYDVFDDVEKIQHIVDAFNAYNVDSYMKYGRAPMKYLTVRDILCVQDKSSVRVGFLSSYDDSLYGRRVTQRVSVSLIDPNESEQRIVQPGYFLLPEDGNSRLYPVRYMYDIDEAAYRPLSDLINKTGSYDNDAADYTIDENGNEIYGLRSKKFLYYTCSKYMSNSMLDKLKSVLAESADRVYISSLYRPVYTAINIVSDMCSEFKLHNLIESKFIDMYGDINEEYITYRDDARYLTIKNSLWGKIKPESDGI